MAESHLSSSYEGDMDSDNDPSSGSSLQMKRNRWGKTPYPIPTATMSLDEENSLHASKKSDTPSSMISPTGQIPLDSGGK